MPAAAPPRGRDREPCATLAPRQNGRDSGAADPPPFRALMPNPHAPTLPIGLGAIGKVVGYAASHQGTAAVSICGDSARDENRHLPICRTSRPDPSFFQWGRAPPSLQQGRKQGNWTPLCDGYVTNPAGGLPLTAGFAMISAMKQQLHIKVSGGLEGDFVVTEERGGDEFVITRESAPSLKSIRERAGAREATDEEFAAFEAEHGPFLPPDGEG